MIVCPNCKHKELEGTFFCAECGAAQMPEPAVATRSFCDQCGRPMRAGANFCAGCGATKPTSLHPANL